MMHVDGFTLIDYIKSSIEILMNMRDEEDGNDQTIRNGNTSQSNQLKDHSLSDLELLENDDLLAKFPPKNMPAALV